MSSNDNVRRWLSTIWQVRADLGLTADKYADATVLSLIQIESNGNPHARRTNPNGKLSQFVGLLQIGTAAGEDVGFQPPRLLEMTPERAGAKGIETFLKYAEKYKHRHEYEPAMIALVWKGGPGTVRNFRRIRDEQGEPAAVGYLSTLWGGSPVTYLKRFQTFYPAWAGDAGALSGAVDTSSFSGPTLAGSAAPARASGGAVLPPVPGRYILGGCSGPTDGAQVVLTAPNAVIDKEKILEVGAALKKAGGAIRDMFVDATLASGEELAAAEPPAAEGSAAANTPSRLTAISTRPVMANKSWEGLAPPLQLIATRTRNKVAGSSREALVSTERMQGAEQGGFRQALPGAQVLTNDFRDAEGAQPWGITYALSSNGKGSHQLCYAPFSGTVVKVSQTPTYGQVLILTSDRYTARLGYLERVHVQEGAVVAAGEVLATCDGGNSDQLRLEIYREDDKEVVYLDPQALLRNAASPLGEPVVISNAAQARQGYAAIAASAPTMDATHQAMAAYDQVTSLERAEKFSQYTRLDFYTAHRAHEGQHTEHLLKSLQISTSAFGKGKL